MSNFMESIFGTYAPIISESGDMQPDWSYIGSVLIFVIFLYCVFRLIGGWTSRK